MRSGKEQPRWEANRCVARAAFKHDILRIVLSDLDSPLELHSWTDFVVHMRWWIFKDLKVRINPGKAGLPGEKLEGTRILHNIQEWLELCEFPRR